MSACQPEQPTTSDSSNTVEDPPETQQPNGLSNVNVNSEEEPTKLGEPFSFSFTYPSPVFISTNMQEKIYIEILIDLSLSNQCEDEIYNPEQLTNYFVAMSAQLEELYNPEHTFENSLITVGLSTFGYLTDKPRDGYKNHDRRMASDYLNNYINKEIFILPKRANSADNYSGSIESALKNVEEEATSKKALIIISDGSFDMINNSTFFDDEKWKLAANTSKFDDIETYLVKSCPNNSLNREEEEAWNVITKGFYKFYKKEKPNEYLQKITEALFGPYLEETGAQWLEYPEGGQNQNMAKDIDLTIPLKAQITYVGISEDLPSISEDIPGVKNADISFPSRHAPQTATAILDFQILPKCNPQKATITPPSTGGGYYWQYYEPQHFNIELQSEIVDNLEPRNLELILTSTEVNIQDLMSCFRISPIEDGNGTFSEEIGWSNDPNKRFQLSQTFLWTPPVDTIPTKIQLNFWLTAPNQEPMPIPYPPPMKWAPRVDNEIHIIEGKNGNNSLIPIREINSQDDKNNDKDSEYLLVYTIHTFYDIDLDPTIILAHTDDISKEYECPKPKLQKEEVLPKEAFTKGIEPGYVIFQKSNLGYYSTYTIKMYEKAQINCTFYELYFFWDEEHTYSINLQGYKEKH